ncbi:serine hydrolase domain-containing protein [Paraferrimonas sedimenticola]|uniref:6-aminohexanoate-dimer hydrolase n=1 Tax=Paraferrimonas sedimenticola TaxID=375674 RepID=A0AA37VTX2_9GAMM|nr:serine hydrolase domain-containing protein [Paraferrimonas sedimenticola]GLP95604.1 6-aminohexanoate-dimer hydrolase [Paraferrimonas sedimenticola]
MNTKGRFGAISLSVCAAMFSLGVAASDANPYASAAELGLQQGFPPAPEAQVTKDNALLFAPYNRWSYQNMRMFYPSANIENPTTASVIEKSIDSGLDKLSIQKGESEQMVDMQTYLRETYTDALVVVKGDKLVYENYQNGMGPNKAHQMMSVTKSFAGLLALMAQSEGKLNEDKPVTDYLPELKGTAFDDASLRHVMDMTNSMSFSEVYDDPNSDIVQYATVLGWFSEMEGVDYSNSLYEYLKTLKKDPELKHGEVMEYSTPKTDVINWITNRVNDKPFQQDMAERLWAKLGTQGENYALLDKTGVLVAGGGLNASPMDLARFGMMMVNKGQFQGEQVVAPEIINDIADGASKQAMAKGSSAYGIYAGGDWSYRAQWWVRHTEGKEAIMAIGIHGQWIYLDLEREVAIIKQSSQPESSTNYYDEYTINGFDAIVKHLSE